MGQRLIVGLLCVAVLLALGKKSAEAELVKSDFLAAGDGLLVTDTETRRVWLSPVFTKGRSYDDVVAGFGDLLTTHGFQFATSAEVRAMINENFDNPPPAPGTAAGFLAATQFFELFGVTEHLSCPGATPPGPCPRSQAWAVDPGTLTGLGMITLGGTVGYIIDFSSSLDVASGLRDAQRGVWLHRPSPPNTPAGSDVEVTTAVTLPSGMPSGLALVFEQVHTAGDTSAVATAAGEPPPPGFKLTTPAIFYTIDTTATYAGSVRICIGWTEGQVVNETTVGMFQHDGDTWISVTDAISRDPIGNTICGVTDLISLPLTLFDVKYPFTGFFSPVDVAPIVNSVKAGAAVPVKFSLGGDRGLNIFAAGYPRARQMQCVTGAALDVVEETVTAGGASLTYDPVVDRYTYVWKSDKSWAGSCRELEITFDDGETYVAWFSMKK
jgi:hypothetical protein